jgi:hypothetical protein
MSHKAFEIIGERTIVDHNGRNVEGIFKKSQVYIKQKCSCCENIIEIIPWKTLDFVIPVYDTNPKIERLAMGRIPQERINMQNPILHLWSGVDLNKLEYNSKENGSHIFKGELHGPGVYVNDGNFGVFNKYVEPLRKAGFEIYAVRTD